jgi:hypothetical protein
MMDVYTLKIYQYLKIKFAQSTLSGGAVYFVYVPTEFW